MNSSSREQTGLRYQKNDQITQKGRFMFYGAFLLLIFLFCLYHSVRSL